MVDRLDADAGIARGSQELQLVVQEGHGRACARQAALRPGR
jgi:hypothetical protein